MIERVWIIRNTQGGEVLRVIARRDYIELRTAADVEVLTLHPEEARDLSEALSQAEIEVSP